MKLTITNAIACIVLSIALSACGGGSEKEDSSSNVVPPPLSTPPNSVPEARITGTSESFTHQKLYFSASGSSDEDGDVLSYKWQIIDVPNGSSAELDSFLEEEITFTPDLAGFYVIQLIVNDGIENSPPANFQFVIEDPYSPPTAIIQHSSDLRAGVNIEFDGSSSTFDSRTGASLIFSWVLTDKPSNSEAKLSSTNEPIALLLADVEGSYSVELKVQDQTGAVALENFNILVKENSAPTAEIAVDYSYVIGTEAYAYALVKDDDLELSYIWTINSAPNGSSLTGHSSDKPYLAFLPDMSGEYTIQLSVSDGFNTTESELRTLTITERNGYQFNIRTASNYFGKINTPILIDFGKTISPTGSTLTFSKRVISGPSGSRPSLTTSILNKGETEFSADRAGNYSVRIIATNEEGQSVSKTVQIKLFDDNTNLGPIPNAYVPRKAKLGDDTILDARTTTDPEGDIINYEWRLSSKPSFSTAKLSSSTNAKTNVNSIDVPGYYVVQNRPTDNLSPILTVKSHVIHIYESFQSLRIQDMDEIKLFAGENMALPAVIEGKMEQTDSLKWDLIHSPYNSSEQLVNSDILNPDFRFDVEGKYVFQLRLMRGDAIYDVDHLIVRASSNFPPISNAGNDMTATAGSDVILDGSASEDFDDELTYEWSVVGSEGPLLNLPNFDDPTLKSPVLSLDEDYTGQLVVRLAVSDGINEPSSDELIIQIASAATSARLETFDLSNLLWNEATLPYNKVHQVDPSDSSPGDEGIQILGMFHVYAENANITIADLEFSSLNNVVQPSISIIDFDFSLPAEQQKELDYTRDIQVKKDDFVSITLVSPANTEGQIATFELSFSIKETGETFYAQFEYSSSN